MVRLVLVAALIGATAVLADEKKAKKVELPADLKELVKLLDESRAKLKTPAPPLVVDSTLNRVAADHAKYMAKQEKLSGTANGKGLAERVKSAGYDFIVVAQNLADAEGKVDEPAPKPAVIHQGWLDSKVTRATLLNANFTHVGLGMAQSKKGTFYFVQILATPLHADLKEMLKLLNEARAKEKLPALKLNATLCRVARTHTQNMAKKEKMAHELDGKRVPHRVESAGYDYRFVGENLAGAEGKLKDPAPKPAALHKGWMESKGHRENILNGKFTEVGLAMVQSKKGTYYYTQVFASRSK
jgi:uncharacterized protein YkwD